MKYKWSSEDLFVFEESKSIHELFAYVVANGKQDRDTIWNRNIPLMQVINHKLPTAIEMALNSRNTGYCGIKAIGKSGSSGRWNNTTYIGILDESNKKNGKYDLSIGIYPIYLISPDCEKIYLAYILGIGSKSERNLQRMGEIIRKNCSFSRFRTDTKEIDLGKDPHHYKAAIIAYLEYGTQKIPDDFTLIDDLIELLSIHQKAKGEPYSLAIEDYRNKMVRFGL